MTYSHQF